MISHIDEFKTRLLLLINLPHSFLLLLPLGISGAFCWSSFLLKICVYFTRDNIHFRPFGEQQQITMLYIYYLTRLGRDYRRDYAILSQWMGL